MALDDLMKAFGAFQEGVTKAGVAAGIGRAQDQVNMIQQQQMAELDKRKQLTGVANNLVMELSGMGAKPEQVSQAAGVIMPDPIKSSKDMLTQAAITGDAGLKQTGSTLQKDENSFEQGKHDDTMALGWAKIKSDEKIAGMKKENKLDQTQLSALMKTKDKLNADGKKYFDGMEQARNVRGLLNSNNPLADNTIPTFLARASGEVGNLSEADKAPFGGSRAIGERIKQAMVNAKAGTLTTENRALIAKIADTMEKNNKRSIENIANRHSKQLGGIIGVDATELRGRLLPDGWDQGDAQAAAPQLPAGIPQGSVPTTIKLNDGTYKKVYKAPTGDYYPAE